MNTVNSSAAPANQATPSPVMWNPPPRSADSPISTATWRADEHERDDQVADHEVGARDRRGQQLALRAAMTIDDHAQPGEDAAQRDHQADRADAHERLVVDAGMQPAGRDLQRRRDDQRQQRRADQRHEDLTRVPRGERGAPAGERGERAGRRARRSARGAR